MSVEADPLTTRTARQRIGGRWALAWQTYLITGALALLSLVAGQAQSSVGTFPALSWLLIAIIGVAAIGAALLVLNATLFRNRREHPLPIWVVVVADGAMGLIFTLVASGGASLLHLTMTPGLAEQATLNVLYAMWWGPTLSYFMDLREQWANEREALVAEYVRVELASMQQGELVHRLQEELDAEVEHELTPARTHLHSLRREFQDGYSNDSGTRTTDWDAAARLLRGTAEHSVRPLSRKLLHQEQTTYPMMRWWMVLVNVVQSQPFRPLPFAVIDILGTFSAQIRTFGLMRGLLLLFGGLAWTILLMTIANAFMRRFPHRHSAIFIGAIIALQSTVFLRGHFRELWVPGSAEASWTITQIVAGIVVIFVTSGFGAWWSQRLAARDIVRDEIRIDRVRAMARSQQIAILARETSQVLHGSVQTRLVSCAMGIEQASATGNVELLSAALTEAIAVLDRPEEESVQTGSLADEVSRKLALWDGLCAFTVTLDPAAFTAPPNSSIVIGRVVEEGIANAIRHGKASEIEVGVARIDGETIQVVVSDNGRGPGGGTPGLGSAYLQQASAHRWSLTFDGQQTHLCVLVTA